MISVVVPSYNRRDSVLTLLADLYAQEDVEFEVIVVDDGSQDDTVAAVTRTFPQTTVIANPSNAGPAVCRNRGIRVASGDIIVGFDSDVTLPDRSLLSKVISTFEQPGAAAGLAFRILQPDGESEDVGRWWHPLSIEDYATTSFFTSYFSGTAYAFRRDVLIDAGLYPEILYMHFEEVELAWRVLDNGGRILYSPELGVLHHVNNISRRSEVEVFYKPRNQLLLAVSCLPVKDAISYVIPRMTFQFLKACSRGHLGKFLSSMDSARRLMPRQLTLRKPLKKTTLLQIHSRKFSKPLRGIIQQKLATRDHTNY